MDNEQRLQQLEERLMYAEQTIDTLDHEVLRQQRAMQSQHKDIERLRGQIEQMSSTLSKSTPDEPPPPHY